MLGSYWDCRIEVQSVGKALLNDSRTGPGTPTKCTLESAKVTKANFNDEDFLSKADVALGQMELLAREMLHQMEH